MTDAVFHELPGRKVTVTYFVAQTTFERRSDESECIPDWAAIAVAIGLIMALGGFIYAWFSDRGWATAVLTLGLMIAAVGMYAAEQSVNQKSEWRVL